MEAFFDRVIKNSDLFLAVGMMTILSVMVIPMPPFFIDLLLSLGITSAIVLMLTSLYVTRALDFSIFPTLLLFTTLFRLSVNVATTRIILLNGAESGTSAAGEIIKAFGEFVVGGNYAVGIVIFIILVIINFIVITKGAGRVAEVAARFTLDAMPGKQMSIDADLNAGVINEKEAKIRRDEISRESDFYGAMDGASKFVRGDAIAGMLIVLVNIIGGIIIGTLQKGMDISSAAKIFTLLTIGDGLVSQIPALIISTSAGIIVTRTASGKNLGKEFNKQVFKDPKTLFTASGVLFVLGIVPGLPFLPFSVFSIISGLIGYMVYGKKKKAIASDLLRKEEEELRPKEEKIENLLSIDLLELEVGYGLINIVDTEKNGDLLERITNIRKQFALDLGIVVPPIRIRDNLELNPGDYQVLLKGVPIGSGTLMVDHFLAMDPGNVTSEVNGVPAKEPAFGLDALWITEDKKEEATFAGYTVVDLSTVIATHLTELVRQNSNDLLGRQELQSLLDTLKEHSPKVIEDVIPNLLPTGVVLRVLKNLLKESVSIRDLRTILETLADQAQTIKDPDALTEYVRVSLSRSITQKISDDGKINLLTLDKDIEETIANGIIQTDQGQQLSIDPQFVRGFIAELNEKAIELVTQYNQAVILCSPVIRRHLKGLVDRFIPNIVVLSHNEISPNIEINSYGMVRLSNAN